MTSMTAEHFWSRVQRGSEDECWPWLGGLDHDGYGKAGYDGKNIKAHKLAWFYTYGDFGDQFTLHSCNSPSCCNPKHLYQGTHQDNMYWAVTHGTRKGERNAHSKLTEGEITIIRELYHSKRMTQKELAEMFGVQQGHISRIIRKAAW